MAYIPPEASNGIPCKKYSSPFIENTFGSGNRFKETKHCNTFGPAK